MRFLHSLGLLNTRTSTEKICRRSLINILKNDNNCNKNQLLSLFGVSVSGKSRNVIASSGISMIPSDSVSSGFALATLSRKEREKILSHRLLLQKRPLSSA